MRIAVYDHKMDAVTIFQFERAHAMRHEELVQVDIDSWPPTPALAPDDPVLDLAPIVHYRISFRFIRIGYDLTHHQRGQDWWAISAVDPDTSMLLRTIYLDELWVRPGRHTERMAKQDRDALKHNLRQRLGRAIGA